MSTFTENWVQCMHSNGFPVASVEDFNEALEFVDKIHSAIENAGGEVQVTIGTLVALGALAGVDEVALLAVADVAAIVYLSACIGCLASVALDSLISLSANNELPDFVVAELNNQGVDLSGEAVA